MEYNEKVWRCAPELATRARIGSLAECFLVLLCVSHPLGLDTLAAPTLAEQGCVLLRSLAGGRR